jgi:hypothetical protein
MSPPINRGALAYPGAAHIWRSQPLTRWGRSPLLRPVGHHRLHSKRWKPLHLKMQGVKSHRIVVIPAGHCMDGAVAARN